MTFLYVTAAAFWAWFAFCFAVAGWAHYQKRRRARAIADAIAAALFAGVGDALKAPDGAEGGGGDARRN